MTIYGHKQINGNIKETQPFSNRSILGKVDLSKFPNVATCSTVNLFLSDFPFRVPVRYDAKFATCKIDVIIKTN